jgi:hypothetical protein
MLARVLGGLAIAAVGFVLVWKSEWFHVNFGAIQWAEEKMGSSGGSRLMYKLIGLVVLFISFLMITNLHKIFFISVFGGIFGIKPPEE